MATTIQSALQEGQAKLTKAEIRTARLDSLVLLEKAAGIKREWLLAHPERSMSSETKGKYFTLIKQRSARIPLPQLTGKQEFWGLDFKVNQHTLIPRPESEKIVEYALEYAHAQTNVLDVGTGCGCIAIAIAKERPNWQVSATDLSADALRVAKSNAKKHGTKISFIKSDLFENIDVNVCNGRYKHLDKSRLQSQGFDVVTANLPYLRAGQKTNLTPEATKEPAVALFGGEDGLDIYRRFFSQITDVSKPNGLVIIEADPWQHDELIKLAKAAGLKLKSQDRFVLSFAS